MSIQMKQINGPPQTIFGADGSIAVVLGDCCSMLDPDNARKYGFDMVAISVIASLTSEGFTQLESQAPTVAPTTPNAFVIENVRDVAKQIQDAADAQTLTIDDIMGAALQLVTAVALGALTKDACGHLASRAAEAERAAKIAAETEQLSGGIPFIGAPPGNRDPS